MKTTGKFKAANGIQYYYQHWKAEQAKAQVCIVHGYADHIGRFDHVAEFFVERGFNVFGFDLRGHGRSDGKRVYINSFNEYVEDLTLAMEYFFDQHAQKNVPTFIYSHSMGTLVSLYYLVDHQSKMAGWISTGGLIKPNEDISPLLVKMSGFLSIVAPSLRTIGLDLNDLSRNPKTKPAAENDPHYDHGGIRARTGKELLEATKKSASVIPKIRLPLLIYHGTDDKLSQPAGSQQLHDISNSSDKTLKFWPDAFHELVNELNREEVMEDMVVWMEARVISRQ